MTALNEESVAWDFLGDSGKRFTRLEGRGMAIESIITQYPERIGGIVEGGSLPAAIAPDTDEALFTAQAIVGVWETSWSSILRAKRSKAAFKGVIEMHQEGLRSAFIQDMSNELMDNGKGRLAVLSAATNSTTQDALSGHPGVRKGMVLDCMDVGDDDTVHANSSSVTAVDETTPQFTVSGAPSSTATGDYWCREDTTDDSQNDALHLNGLLGIVSNANPASVVGNYAGINRSTAGKEFWESPVLANGGVNRPLTSDVLMQAQRVRRKTGGKNNKQGRKSLAWFMNAELEGKYVELFEALRFVDTGSSAFQGDAGPVHEHTAKGMSAFTFSGLPIHTDVFAPANTIFLLDKETFSIGYVGHKVPRPIDEIFDGQIPFFRQTSNASFEKVWYFEGDLICTKPRANVRIDDVAQA
jgi:hypothetical protein